MAMTSRSSGTTQLQAAPDRYGDNRKGLDVYVDGRLVASAMRSSRLCADLAPGVRPKLAPGAVNRLLDRLDIGR